MANYLLNLGVSTLSAVLSDGNFQADNGNANPLLRSEVWLTGGSGLTLTDNFYQLPSALVESQWSFELETSSALNLDTGDYILVRVFQVTVQPSPTPSLVLNAVFGQGSAEPAGTSAPLQSPLAIAGFPRTVVDSFQLAFASNPQHSNSIGQLQTRTAPGHFALVRSMERITPTVSMPDASSVPTP
jgi:hypothetical protein